MTDTPYEHLTPDTVLDAVESIGYLSDARIFPLNSYENRVYQIGMEDQEPIIGKFYRPNRWSKAQIQEEHTFSYELEALEIPVISPLKKTINGEPHSLFEFQNYLFSLYPRRGGYAPELDNLDTLYTLGQHIGRIHLVGKKKRFDTRLSLSLDHHVIKSREFLLENNFIPSSLLPAYETLSQHIIEKLTPIFQSISTPQFRIHGDCHPGNILVRPDSLYIVDLDDAINGPAIQDIWMLISGDRQQATVQLETILEGYEEFCDFPKQEIQLIESLRTLRLMYYAAWLARRWHDPAFPMAFPWFNTERYWSEHILELREQMAALDAPPLTLTQGR